MKAIHERRFKALAVPTNGRNGFGDLLAGRARVVSGIPADADVARVGYDPATDTVLFILASKSYPVGLPGHAIERIDVQMERCK